MSNKTKRVMAAILAVVLVIATMLGLVTPLFAGEIEDLEAQQQQLAEEAERKQAMADASADQLRQAQEKVEAAIAEMQELTEEIEKVAHGGPEGSGQYLDGVGKNGEELITLLNIANVISD